MPSLSIRKGRGSLSHNDRTIVNRTDDKSWDAELSHLNIKYVNEPLKEVYKKLFDGALEKYNQKMIDSGHSERQIKDYLYHINHSKQEKAFYELIIEIGNIDDKNGPEYIQIQKALDEYNKGFQERNPNMYVFKQITHRDEKGMDHTHIDFIPFTSGSKRGLETRNTLSGALKEMGFGRNGFESWVNKEKEIMIEIMKENGLEHKVAHANHDHMTTREYVMTQQAIVREANKRLDEVKVPNVEVKTNPITKRKTVTLSEEEYKSLCTSYEFQIESLRASNNLLERELDRTKMGLKKEKTREAVKENNFLKEYVDVLKKEKKDYVLENNRLKRENRKLKTEKSDLENDLNIVMWYKTFFDKVIELFSKFKDRGEHLIQYLDIHPDDKDYIREVVDEVRQERIQKHEHNRGMER